VSTDLLGHRFDPRLIAQEQAEPAGFPEQRPVGLQPTRRASTRQPTVGNDDIGPRAGTHHLIPAHEIAGARYQYTPAASPTLDVDCAKIGAARSLGQAFQLAIFGIGTGQLG
jgi:hypothetical protein